MKQYRPVALIILDGWGIREMEHGNAVLQADTPNFDRWLRTHERSILDASGEEVGLPADQMGNSEVGHLNLGGGRIVYQDLTRINRAIRDGSLAHKEALADAVAHLRRTGGRLHLIGLLGPGGVHSHSEHLFALLRFAKGHGVRPIVHVITDGRDTPPESAAGFLQTLQPVLDECDGEVATVCGRYYAMDRDKRWPRTEMAYRAMVFRQGERQANSAAGAIAQSYAEGVTDEFILPATVGGGDAPRISSGDCLLFFNFRADRMRQLVRSFAMPAFDGFQRAELSDLLVVTMTRYEQEIPARVIFADEGVPKPLAEVVSDAGLTQFHAAETEKYAHVTYFFNGGVEPPFPGEERLLVPSPKVATYDLKPEMSAHELTAGVLQRLAEHNDAFILVNYANPDMVGHTGVLQAAIAACTAVDECAGRLVDAVLAKGGVALVTADHGNAERMIDELTGGPHTYHTTGAVSLIPIGAEYFAPRPRGILADVAPTVLELLGLEQPAEMTGRSLLHHHGL